MCGAALEGRATGVLDLKAKRLTTYAEKRGVL